MRRVAKHWVAQVQSMGISTIAASGWITKRGRNSAIAVGVYGDVLPYFREMENRIGDGDNAFRGQDGPLTVTDIDWTHPLCEAFIAGAETLGIPRNKDYNGAIQEGISYAQRTIQNGRRVSAATAFLHPAMRRPNLSVRTHAHVVSLLFDGRRASGVRYVKGGRGGPGIEVGARREVILSGGTYNSPQLLQLSGIGRTAPLGATRNTCVARTRRGWARI